MNDLKIITCVAPYVTIANAFESVTLAHEDGFSGIELAEDHLHSFIHSFPNGLAKLREYSKDKRMINSIHGTLNMPSIDSHNSENRQKAVDYTKKTIDFMESAGISRMVLHSFSDLPQVFRLKAPRANRSLYFAGCHSVRMYALLAPALKAYRKRHSNALQRNFMSSLSQIARYAADKRVNGQPIEIVFEEHYSDAIDYDIFPYGKGKFHNVIRGIDTAHQLIRTGTNSDLANIAPPIHFHAVDTNGIIDDHRTIGKGKVNFEKCLTELMQNRLSDTIVLEDSARKSVLISKEALKAKINHASFLHSSTS